MELNDLKPENDSKSLMDDGAIWQEEHENILADWADKAMCFRWLHNRSNQKFNKLGMKIDIPIASNPPSIIQPETWPIQTRKSISATIENII